jgi:hypothetical protein
MARKPNTVETLMTFLNAIIEEGIIDMSTFATKLNLSGKQSVKCGLITSMTPAVLHDNRRKWLQSWKDIGFMTRPIWVSYDYTQQTEAEVRQAIAMRQDRVEYRKIYIKHTKKDIALSANLAVRIADIAKVLGAEMGSRGFRAQTNLQTLAKAIAYDKNSEAVTEEHFNELLNLTRYMNLKCIKV